MKGVFGKEEMATHGPSFLKWHKVRDHRQAVMIWSSFFSPFYPTRYPHITTYLGISLLKTSIACWSLVGSLNAHTSPVHLANQLVGPDDKPLNTLMPHGFGSYRL